MTYQNIGIALVLGTIIGVPMALMPMTAVPQRTALSHAFGALAAALVGGAEYSLRYTTVDRFTMFALVIEVLLGSLTFTASLMAFGKLQEILPQRPITYKGQNFVNLGILGVAILLGVGLVLNPTNTTLFPVMVILAFTFGIMLIVPIGGADMPTVIALLNSYAGLSAAAMGFALDNKLLIIAGSLDGASGLILSIIMCKAMNRSFANVLFGAFGQIQTGPAGKVEAKPVKSATNEEAAAILANASLVVVIPGYGMAVAQAQHKVRELHDVLAKKGVEGGLRHSSGGRPHARAHERPARRGRRALRQAPRDGGGEQRTAGGRRRSGDRGQRRDQPRGPARYELAGLRHAHHRRRQGPAWSWSSSAR